MIKVVAIYLLNETNVCVSHLSMYWPSPSLSFSLSFSLSPSLSLPLSPSALRSHPTSPLLLSAAESYVRVLHDNLLSPSPSPSSSPALPHLQDVLSLLQSNLTSPSSLVQYYPRTQTPPTCTQASPTCRGGA